MDEIPASEFDFRDFDVREFVQRYRKRLPLPQLQKALRAHHAATRQELVELINEKYADFVNLSSRMQGVERALKPLRAPLEESAELTRGLRARLGSLLAQAEQVHGSLARIRARRSSLTAYVEGARLLDKAKAAAAGRQRGEPRETDEFLQEHVAQENIARDLRRVRLSLGGEPCRSASSAAPPPPPPPPPPAGAGGQAAPEGPEGPEGGVAAGEGASSPECRALLQEAAELEEAFGGRLRERLHGLISAIARSWGGQAGGAGAGAGAGSQSVEPGQPSRAELLAVAHLARALVTIGRAGVVEEAFADVFAKSALESAATACAGASEDAQRRAGDPAGGTATLSMGAGAMNLGPFFDSVQVSLLREDSPLVWFARCFHGSASSTSHDPLAEGDSGDALDSAMLVVPNLRLVSNAAVAPVLRYVQQVWPNVFMPAFPDVFAANYVHAANFVRAAEALMTPSESRAVAHNTVLSEFRRKWKTQVYASLRSKEAVQRLEVAAAKSRTIAADASVAPSSAPQHQAVGRAFWMEASAELVRVLETVWSERWSLDVLYAKSLQLSLELLVRYGRAVRALAAEPGAAEGAGWDAASAPPRWAPASRPVRLARAAADVLAVLGELGDAGAAGGGDGGRLVRLALARLPAGAAGARPPELVRALMHEGREGLRPALAELEAAMLEPVTAQAAAQFAAIRGIPAFYRMLNKPVPTRASPYVESAARPLQALREAALQVAPAEVVAGWVQRAVDGAAAEFSAQAAQLLESTHQQEASLRRLAGRGSGSDSRVSDLEKIHIQLCLDVETFAAAAAEIGAEAAEGSGLSRLAEVITPVRHTFEAHRLAAG